MLQHPRLEDVVLFLVAHAPAPLGITQVMKLVYLADVEHMRLYGAPLTDSEWIWYHYGPFTRAVYEAVEDLDEAELIHDEITVSGVDRQRSIASADDPVVARETKGQLSPRAYRALTRTLQRYGNLPLHALERVAYETTPMRVARQGERLDLSKEPPVFTPIPGVADFLKRAPSPDLREWGDPEVSAAEDIALLSEFSALRREATQENE